MSVFVMMKEANVLVAVRQSMENPFVSFSFFFLGNKKILLTSK